MPLLALPEVPKSPSPISFVRHLTITVVTSRPVEFVDLTVPVNAAVQCLGLVEGTVTVHTRHTTTGILINEHEPLLLDDLTALFERTAPCGDEYAHDDFLRRTVNLMPGERRNGHAHCRAALLRSSESVPVSDTSLMLGRWQRILFVDFDGGQRREITLTLMGMGRSAIGGVRR